jgi:ABC-type multidrug transport system ATPase subunit
LKNEEGSRVQTLINSFGLKRQADTLIGTPIRKGISGGQKRRVSVASQLVTAPNILFLDEPTSGLDSVASLKVVSLLKEYAQKHKLIVVASIHQPSAATFQLFDKLLKARHATLVPCQRLHHTSPASVSLFQNS